MNAELLRKTAKMQVDMTYWFQMKGCGTVGCLAGNIATICGATPVWGHVIDSRPDMASMCRPKNKSELEFVLDFAVEQIGTPNIWIFLVSHWPEKLMEKLGIGLGVNPSQKQIQAAVEDYITTNGWTDGMTL